MNNITRQQTFRLFQQLHQNDDPEWRRANGSIICIYCGYYYRQHPLTEEWYPKEAVDHRLCNGDIVHL